MAHHELLYVTELAFILYRVITRLLFPTILEVNLAINSAKSGPESSVIGHTLRCHISYLLQIINR